MRAFIALELPCAFESEVAGVARQLAAAIEGRYLLRESYHVTLAFLGDIPEAQVRAAMDALDEACAQAWRVTLEPDGLGTFGKPHNATLWLGLVKDPSLMGLAERMRRALSAHGLSIDERPFRPHITIARHASIQPEALPALAFPLPAAARCVTLFKSTLAPDGAVYDAIHTAELR